MSTTLDRNALRNENKTDSENIIVEIDQNEESNNPNHTSATSLPTTKSNLHNENTVGQKQLPTEQKQVRKNASLHHHESTTEKHQIFLPTTVPLKLITTTSETTSTSVPNFRAEMLENSHVIIPSNKSSLNKV